MPIHTSRFNKLRLGRLAAGAVTVSALTAGVLISAASVATATQVKSAAAHSQDHDISKTADGFVLGVTKPDAANTGVPKGTVLTPHKGDLTISTPNAVVSGLDISGRVFIKASGVQLRNSKIRGQAAGTTSGGLIQVTTPGVTNVVIDRNEIYQDQNAWFWMDGVQGNNFTATRNHIHDTVDGFGVMNTAAGAGGSDYKVSIQGNYVTDHTYVSDPTEPHSDRHTHNDGVQMHGGKGITLEGNHFTGKASTRTGNSATKNPYHPNITGQGVAYTPILSPITEVRNINNFYDGAASAITIAKGNYTGMHVGEISGNRFGRTTQLVKGIRHALQVQIATPATIINAFDNTYQDDGAPIAVTYF